MTTPPKLRNTFEVFDDGGGLDVPEPETEEEKEELERARKCPLLRKRHMQVRMRLSESVRALAAANRVNEAARKKKGGAKPKKK